MGNLNITRTPLEQMCTKTKNTYQNLQAAALPGICIWCMTGELVLEVPSSEITYLAVWKLKQTISSVTNVTPACQQLLVGNRPLNDRSVLCELWLAAPKLPLDVQLVVLPEPEGVRVTTPTSMCTFSEIDDIANLNDLDLLH